MAKDEATEEVSLDEDVPVDDVLADAQDTLADIEGADGGDLDGDPDLGAGGGSTGAEPGLDGSARSRPAADPVVDDRAAGGTESDGGRSILPGWPSDLFSLTHFLGAAILATAGGAAGGVLIPIPILGSAVGLLAAGFLAGVATDRSSYLEVGLASGIVGAVVSAVVGIPLLAVVGLGAPVFVVGAALTLVVGLLGHYLGRDLRSGLTRDVGGGDDPI